MVGMEQHSAYSQKVLEWLLVYLSVAIEYVYMYVCMYVEHITVMGVFRRRIKQARFKL